MPEATADVLAAILGATRRIVEVQRQMVSVDRLEERAAARKPRADAFRNALSRAGKVNVIAECKRRSPSRGVLRRQYDPVQVARTYERAGAAAVSVLTEPAFFDGSLEHLGRVREAVSIPVLRKDFVIDEYQILEARAFGADAVLLIVAALDDRRLAQLVSVARRIALAALVEVHDERELDRALAAGADIVGVNSRNLRSLDVDLSTGRSLGERMPRGVIAVAESGIRTRDDLRELASVGYQAFLVGERFMTAADPGAALGELIG